MASQGAPLFCGSASKQVLACTLFDPGRPASSPSAPALRLVAGGYTGWELFKGDILAMAAAPDSHAIFVGTADGCIYGFSINKTGGLSPLAQVAGAHSSRVTGLAVCGAQLYSVGLDGA
ncbi:zinc finger CCCH domain-containing protein 62, partial [Haematococcus lacustris]